MDLDELDPVGRKFLLQRLELGRVSRGLVLKFHFQSSTKNAGRRYFALRRKNRDNSSSSS